MATNDESLKPWEMVAEGKVNIGLADRLYKVKYKTDEISHLKIKNQDVCRQCEDKPCMPRCPAQVYDWDRERQEIMVAYENCLECGVCKVVCPYDNIDWEYPRGGFGVVWKFG